MGKAKKTTQSKRVASVKKAKTKTTTAKRASTAMKKSTTRQSASKVTIDRRDGQNRRKTSDRRKKSEPVAVERRQVTRRVKVNRRRQIDPTTCERDYTPEEIEFMSAMDDYKRVSGRMFPTCSEVLEVIKKLGYEKQAETATAPRASRT